MVSLPTAPSMGNLRANAGKVTMDLGGSTFTSLDLQPNAADVHLRADASITGFDMEMNAGSAPSPPRRAACWWDRSR